MVIPIIPLIPVEEMFWLVVELLFEHWQLYLTLFAIGLIIFYLAERRAKKQTDSLEEYYDELEDICVHGKELV